MANKKIIELIGTVVYPITVGEPAIIQELSGMTRKTSTVLKIETKSDKEIRFETRNSIYCLKAQQKKSLAALMLRKMFEVRDSRC